MDVIWAMVLPVILVLLVSLKRSGRTIVGIR